MSTLSPEEDSSPRAGESLTTREVDTRRVTIFLVFAFGIAWAVALVIYLTGGLKDSPMLLPALNLNLATVLLAVAYMPAPALAHVITRLITREGWRNTYLRPELKRGWPYWLFAWFGPAILTVLGGVVYFLIFPQHFDPSLSTLQELLDAAAARTGQEIALPFPIWVLAALQAVQGVLLAPVINSLFTFGEEFGWRAYLQPKLLPLGWRPAMVWMGVIWGLWHAPVIAMGHNYGLEYPGAPWAGVLMMIWFTFVTGTFLGWLTLRGGSVWPAVIGHAALNGIAGLAALFTRGEPNPLLGPLPVGFIGGMGFTLVALWLLWKTED